MPNTFQTLNDLLKIDDQNLADRQITDLLNAAPVLALLPADLASHGTKHEYVKETGAPVVGFRAVNAGRHQTVSSDTLVTVDCKILDGSFAVDKALADAYSKGASMYIGREAARVLRQAFFQFEKQIFNGQVGDADGFVGLADALLIGNEMVVDATGTTAATGSSVYAIRATSDMDGVVAVAGNGGKIEIGDTVTMRIPEVSDATKTYPGYYTPVQGWVALQIGGARSVGRIANLTADSGKTLTDDLIASLLEKFPSAAPPTHLVMNRRSLAQLRASRTATNATGAPAPFPVEAFNIPIIATDAIASTEVLIAEESGS